MRRLFVSVAILVVAILVGWLIGRPYYQIQTIDCGNGKRIEVLRPNVLCDVAGPIHFRAGGITTGKPPAFLIYGCGGEPDFVELSLSESDMAVVVDSRTSSDIFLMVDFKSGWYWPTSADREVTPEVARRLSLVQKEFPDCWLYETYDHSLMRPGMVSPR